MKNKSLIITLIIVLSILVLGLISLMSHLLIKGNRINFNFKKENELIYEEEYNVDEVNNLTINSISSDILFKESTNNEIKVIVYGDKYNNLKVELNNNILTIDYDVETNFCIGICFTNDRLIIYIPNTYNKNIKINTTSGDVLGLNLINAKLDFKSVSGDIQINNIDEASITMTSGEVNINKINKTNIKTVSGDIEINTITEKLNIETTSGEIAIDNLTLTTDSKIKTISGDVEIDNATNIYFDTNTVSGDIKVKNNDRKADYELSIKTTSGDISVNN